MALQEQPYLACDDTEDRDEQTRWCYCGVTWCYGGVTWCYMVVWCVIWCSKNSPTLHVMTQRIEMSKQGDNTQRWCHVVLRGFTWCYVVLCGIMWCYVVLCGVMWCYVVLCGVMWCRLHG
jgi:hypothetical protein